MESLEIRSFRVVFELERRLHKIDRFRLPLPYGLPLRSVGYGFCVLAIVLVAGRVPGLGLLVGALPTPIRLVIAPGAGAWAWALTGLQVDGRPAGATLVALARYARVPRELDGLGRAMRELRVRTSGSRRASKAHASAPAPSAGRCD